MAFKFISALYTDPEVMNLWQNGIQDVTIKFWMMVLLIM